MERKTTLENGFEQFESAQQLQKTAYFFGNRLFFFAFRNFLRRLKIADYF